MHEILLDIRQRLQDKEYQNEEHVRFSLVARVIQALNWNIWNPTEVFTEFKATKKEDNTRVDVALFTHDFEGTAIFIECKNVGAFARDLTAVETQLRDYNRDHTALFTVITDGRHWRFYFSFTSGEFKDKLFCKFDLLQDGPEEVMGYLETFLNRDNILNQSARQKAEAYLMLGKKERAMQDVLPDAQKLVSLPPFPSLPDAMVKLLAAKSLTITHAEAQVFLTGGVSESATAEAKASSATVGSSVAAKTGAAAKPGIAKKITVAKTKVVEKTPVTPPNTPARGTIIEFALVLNRAGVRAVATWDPAVRRLHVQKGSTAMLESRTSMPHPHQQLKEKLLQKGILMQKSDKLEFQQDYLFESAMQASAVICGYSVNGKQAWLDKNDKPLADYVK